MAKKAMSVKQLADAAGWAIGIAGFIIFLYGILLFVSPARTVMDTVFFLGFLLFISGLLKLAEGKLYSKGKEGSGFFVVLGLLAVVIGLIMLLQPGAVAAGVLMTFGFVAILLSILAFAAGIGQIMFAMKRKKNTIPLLIGLFFVLLGLVMLFNPVGTTLALVSLLGLFAVVYGVLMMLLALYVRKMLS
jgi:uncharacterized membrane protein HdeD (DUF308 family)